MASASHSGRKEGFLELARAGTLEQASRIPLIKGAATQLLGSLPAMRWKCFPRADADGKIVCIGLSPKSPPPAPSPAPQAWGWKRGPEQKGRQEATGQIARPSRARRRGSFPAGSGPPRSASTSGARGLPARLDSVEPADSSLEGCAPVPVAPGPQSPLGDPTAGEWGWRAGQSGSSPGRGGRGAPGMGGASGTRVNVRPAPTALTQFHQKLGGGGGRSSAPGSGAEAAGRAAQEGGTGTSAGPAPPHSPAQVTGARRAPRRRQSRPEHVWPFVLRPRVRPGTRAPQPAVGPSVGGGAGGHPSARGRAGRACASPSLGVRCSPPSSALPPGPPASLEVSPADVVCLLLRPLPSFRSQAPLGPRGPHCEGDPRGEEGDGPWEDDGRRPPLPGPHPSGPGLAPMRARPPGHPGRAAARAPWAARGTRLPGPLHRRGA